MKLNILSYFQTFRSYDFDIILKKSQYIENKN